MAAVAMIVQAWVSGSGGMCSHPVLACPVLGCSGIFLPVHVHACVSTCSVHVWRDVWRMCRHVSARGSSAAVHVYTTTVLLLL